MTNEPMVHVAEERLLDAALVQVFARERGKAAVRRTPRWLLAALFLLGLTVTAATMWQARGARTEQQDEAQDPGPTSIREEVAGEGRAGIEALPVTTTNLLAKLVDPRDLQIVTRFEHLRALRLWPEKTTFLGIRTGYHGSWSKAPADLLKSVAELRHLEVLKLPHQLALTAELLAPLAGHGTLHDLHLVGDSFALDDALIAALRKLPALRSLHLVAATLDSAAIRRLGTLPMTTVELLQCNGFDAEAWRALATMDGLQRLVLGGLGRAPSGKLDGTERLWRPEADALRQLGQMPNLQAVEFDGCDLRDDDLVGLPGTLRELHLREHELTAHGFRQLRRLGALRTLAVSTRRYDLNLLRFFQQPPDSTEAADAIAEALTTLRLQQLDYEGAITEALGRALAQQPDLVDLRTSARSHTGDADVIAKALPNLRLRRLRYDGPVNADLCRAIASQPNLVDLELTAERIDSLEGLGDAPALQELRLVEAGVGDGITAATLTPLRSCRNLRELDIHVSVDRATPGADQGDLQQLFGANVRVRLHRNEFTVKK